MTSIPAPRGARLRSPRALGVLGASLVIAAATFTVTVLSPAMSRPAASVAALPPKGPAGSFAAPPLPGDAAPAAIGSLAQIDHSIAAWTANLAENSMDFISATNLATLYHARGRLTGDLDDQTRALEAARTAERIAPTETSAAALEAAVMYTLHDFAGSLAIADRLYRTNPADLGSLATRADDELELGRTAAARADDTVLSAAAAGPAVDVRLARLAYLTGDPVRALTLAEKARDVAASDPQADLGFYDFAVGEYARFLGQSAVARRAYAAAVAVRPTDFASLVGLGKVDAATGHVDAAIAELQDAADIVPQPETLTLLGDLRSMSGDTKGAATDYATIRAIRQLSAIEGSVFDRQLDLFDLDHGSATPAILAGAEAALVLRTDAAGYDLAAWAAYRLGQIDLARSYIGQALAGGIRDARILEHAGAITIAAGDPTTGTNLLKAALALGPGLDPLATAEAHRLLGA